MSLQGESYRLVGLRLVRELGLEKDVIKRLPAALLESVGREAEAMGYAKALETMRDQIRSSLTQWVKSSR